MATLPVNIIATTWYISKISIMLNWRSREKNKLKGGLGPKKLHLLKLQILTGLFLMKGSVENGLLSISFNAIDVN